MAIIEILVWKRDADEHELELILEDVEQMYAWTSLKDEHCHDAFDENGSAPADGFGSLFDEDNLDIVQMMFYSIESFDRYYDNVFEVYTINDKISDVLTEADNKHAIKAQHLLDKAM